MGDETDPGLKERFFFANLNRNALNAKNKTFDEFLKLVPAPYGRKTSSDNILAKSEVFYMNFTITGGK